MKLSKITAVILCGAFIIGTAGCTDKKKPSAEDSIESIMEDYEEALCDFDADGVLVLTDWDDDDRSYREIEELLDIGSYDENMQECYRTIASSIRLDYDIDDIKVKESKASLAFNYKLTDWVSVYCKGPFDSFDEVNGALKTAKETSKISGKINFVLDDGEWKISKITDIRQVFAFTLEKPEVKTEPGITETSSTESSSTEPRVDDISGILESGVFHLQQYETAIRGVEDAFRTDACGVYDINQDGIPEIYYIASDAYYEGSVYSGDLYISTFNFQDREYVRQIVVPGVIYMAAGGGTYMMYVTDKEIIVTHGGGEESLYHVETEVFDLNWKFVARYRRDIYYDYNPESNLETYTYEYFLNDSIISQDTYNAQMTDYINRTEVILDRNYTPLTNDIEYPLIGKPTVGMMGYYEAIDYIRSLKFTV